MKWSSLKNLSHHAYLIIGGDSSRTELLSFLEKEYNIFFQANPDFTNATYDVLTIDDAREIKSIHRVRPITPQGKVIFVLMANNITLEAQNALLKLLEEPAEYAHFFLIVPSAHILLPTVRSRMQEVVESQLSVASSKSAQQLKMIDEANKFLNMSHAKRLEVVKKLTEEITKEKKTKRDAIEFLDAIQMCVYKQGDVKSSRFSLETIETARRYIHDRAPSVKMLLEYVALNV